MIEKMGGRADYALSEKEKGSLKFRRSLFVVQNMSKGERLSPHNVRVIRPGYGVAPKNLETIMGKKVARDVSKGTPLTFDLIEDAENA